MNHTHWLAVGLTTTVLLLLLSFSFRAVKRAKREHKTFTRRRKVHTRSGHSKKRKKKLVLQEYEEISDSESHSGEEDSGIMSGLSSNWKALQKKLQNDGAASKVTKKKTKKVKKTDKHKTDAVAKEQLVETVKVSRRDQKELVKLPEDHHTNVGDLLLAEDLHLSRPAGGSRSSSTITAKHQQCGKYLAVDCEFVGVGPNGARSSLARVSIVNYYGQVVMDKFVKPAERVVDWRTWVSGVRPQDVKDADSFETVQQQVSDLFENKILVGHAIQNDLRALMVSHPKSRIRDTSLHKPFRVLTKGGPPALKRLADEILHLDIQSGQHSSVEDAQATMLLFRLHKHQFDEFFKTRLVN